jgi:tRNA A37 threonylcarbamoyladenosine dehydratase
MSQQDKITKNIEKTAFSVFDFVIDTIDLIQEFRWEFTR